MIRAAQIQEIIKQYEKHGWTLRRVLLCGDAPEAFVPLENSFGGAPIISSDVNAVWFSRPSAAGEAWELRRLTGAPFALVVNFSVDVSESDREKRRGEMQKAVAAKS